MSYKFEIIPYADISTAYITKEDGAMIGDRNCPGHVASVDPLTEFCDDSPGDYFVVPCDPESFKEQQEDLRKSGFSEQFLKIMEELHAQKIQYVRFDGCGGEIEGDAPRQEW